MATTNPHQKWLDFFSTWTRESAWAYGVILGDGHVADTHIRIGCQEDICRKIYGLLGIEREPLKHPTASIYTCIISSRPLSEWFRSRGIQRKKSTCLPWPDDIPEPFIWDFIRGIIDTDGFVSVLKNKFGRRMMVIGLCSATRNFVEKAHAYIDCKGQIRESIKTLREKIFKSYSFKLSHTASVIAGEKIYGDAPSHIRFEDKYLRFVEGKRLWDSYQKGCSLCLKPILSDDLCTAHWWARKKDAEPDLKCVQCDESEFRIGLCKAHYWHTCRVRKARREGRILTKSIPRQYYKTKIEALSSDSKSSGVLLDADVSKLLERKHGPAAASGMKGVRLHKPSGLWKACVNHGGKEISIGYHKTKELAASARQAWVEANIEVLSVQKRKPPVRKHGLCKICGEQVEGRELCKKHYNEWYREEKFKKEGKDYSARRKQLGKERGCSIDGCAAPHKSKGLCEKHYHRQVYQNKLNNSVLGK